MTNTENTETPKCYLCGAIAQGTKLELEIVEYTEDEEITETTRNAICYNCEDAHFDGTEIYPGVMGLHRLAG